MQLFGSFEKVHSYTLLSNEYSNFETLVKFLLSIMNGLIKRLTKKVVIAVISTNKYIYIILITYYP